jgi:uncharacterized membrane protein YgcG
MSQPRCVRERLSLSACKVDGCFYRIGSGLPCKQRQDEEEARRRSARLTPPSFLPHPFNLKDHGTPIPPAPPLRTRRTTAPVEPCVWELRREDSQVVSVQLDSLLSVHDEPTSPGGDPAPATDPTPSFDPGGGDFGGGGSTGDY